MFSSGIARRLPHIAVEGQISLGLPAPVQAVSAADEARDGIEGRFQDSDSRRLRIRQCSNMGMGTYSGFRATYRWVETETVLSGCEKAGSL